MGEVIVQVQHLFKSYDKNFIAVNDVSFEVYRGEIFGLLGPNGAGKTTTLECLEGLRLPDRGVLRINGLDPAHRSRELRNIVGVQLQASGMPETISVKEAMRFFCAYHAVPTRYDLLERLGLIEKMDAQYQSLSTGQKRRLVLALAIAHKPQVVFLDEPTAGLDVTSRVELHEVMTELQQSGVTIILSSHDMAEVEKMANRVAILLRGKVVASGTPRELTLTGDGYTKISVRTEDACLSELTVLPGVSKKTSQEGYEVYFTTDTAASILALLEFINRHYDTLVDLRVERPSLEDRFLEITASQEVVR